MWLQARHLDEFQDRVPRLFLLVVGAVLAAGAAFARGEEFSTDLHLLAGIALTVLAFVGFFASLSIPRFRVIRIEYFNSMIVIRRYFKTRFPEIGSSLWFPTSGLFDGYGKGIFDGYRDFRRNDFFRFLMMVTAKPRTESFDSISFQCQKET